MCSQPFLQFVAIKSSEGHGRHFDFEAAPMTQEAIHENFARITQSDAVRRFVERAHQHQAPEAVYDARRLAVPVEPFAKRWIGVFRHSAKTVQPPENPQLLAEG